MNVGEVLETVEQSLLSRQLNSLERFILCQSWLGRGYSEMAPECAYSIAHIKDIGSQLWQALSKALGKRVTKKNLFLVLTQYLFSKTCETVTSELVEVIDPPLTPPTTNQLPVATDLVEATYSVDSEQLPIVGDKRSLLPKADRTELVTEEDEWLLRVQSVCQNMSENTEAEDNKDASVIQSEQTIPSDCLPLNSLLYINRPPITELTHTMKVKSVLKIFFTQVQRQINNMTI